MSTLIHKPLSDFELRKIEWLPHDRFKIPRGKITLLVGDPGNGKSFVLHDAIAELTRDHGLKAIILSEDDPHDTIKPRIEYMRGNQSLIEVVTGSKDRIGREGCFILGTNKDSFKQLVAETKPAIVAFDPLVSYVGNVNMFKGSDVRMMLDPYVKLAAEFNFALVFVIHLNKADTKAVYKVADSIQTLATAKRKSGYIVGPNPLPGQPYDKVVCHFKTNISKRTPAYTFRIQSNENDPDMAKLEWGDEIDLTADDLVKSLDVGNGAKGSKEEIAKAFLKGALFGGPRFSAEMEEEAKRGGIAPRTFDRAKQNLGIKSEQIEKDGANVWVSYFPEHREQIEKFWRPGVQGQNSDPELTNKLDKLLNLHEKLISGLGVQGFGVQDTFMTQDAKLPPRYESIEVDGKAVSINMSEIMREEFDQFYRVEPKNLGEWERRSWLAWAYEWLKDNEAILN